MSTTTTTVGKFVWHEHVSTDPKQAQEFYTTLFGWDIELFKPGEFDYAMISSGGKSHGGFGKAMEGAPPPHWLGHVHVENVEESVEKAKNAGGKLLAGPFEMGEVGRMAIISDPQGGFVSAFQPESDSPGSEGVFVWDELGTQNTESAEHFYGAVFGWATKDMGAEYGGYKILQRDSEDTGVGGLMGLSDSGMPTAWLPDVAVEDPDRTTAKAKELGGSAMLDPMDVPNVGRIAVLQDPQGAVFGIIKPEPTND